MKYCTPIEYGVQSISCLFPVPGHKCKSKKPTVTMELITETVCTELGIEIEDLLGQSRKRDFADARKVAMHIIRAFLPKLTLKSTGKYFNGRDHSTVLYATDICEELIATDKVFKKRYMDILTEIKLKYDCTE
jgi:chromosomal replication initiator protein